MHEKPKVRKKTLVTWLVLVTAILVLYLINNNWFDISSFKTFTGDHKVMMVILYMGVLTIIGLTFIPSTPLAIAGVLLFSPAEAYIMNLIGIVTSSLIVYYFTKFLRLDLWIEAKYPDKIVKIRSALRRKELPIIAGWSFFPVVPTDLIIYVASTLRISYWKCVVGILIGEGTLNAFYIFSIDFIM